MGEPMAQINWKYYPSNTEGFRWVQRAFGWIQMRYEVNPWLKLIGHIIWAKLMSLAEFYKLLTGSRWGFVEFHGLLSGFVEFYRLLAGSRWGMRVNPWVKLIENMTLAILRVFVEFHGLLAGSRWVLWTFGWIQMRYEGEPMVQINWKYYPSDTDEFPRFPWSFCWIQMRVNPWLKLIENIALAALRSLFEFHGLLAGSRWGMGVNKYDLC